MTLSRKNKIHDVNDIMLIFLIGIAGGVIGAYILRPLMRISRIIFLRGQYAGYSIGELFHYITGEIIFFGGLIGGLIAVILFCKKYKINIISIFDLFAPALALSHGIGRIGCLLGGCCYGIEISYNHPLAIVYPITSLGAPANIPLLAIPLIEAGFLLVLSATLIGIYLKYNRTGITTSIYFMAYPLGRFILEFFRGDALRGRYWMFTTSQYIAIIFFIIGVLLLFVRLWEMRSKDV